MNEKIKEIATQAQLEHCVSHVRLQEFAELIIRECMDVVRHINQDYDGGSTTINAADEIKEHFGVEE